MKLCGKALWDAKWLYQEVWYSPSKFQRDDCESVGFVKLPKGDGNDFGQAASVEFLKGLNKNGHFYTLSALSTSITKDWDKEVEVKDFVMPE
jgi:hypothetical protein